jgi:hypothetical protein
MLRPLLLRAGSRPCSTPLLLGVHAGFNCAEAVNFAPADWLPWGGVGVERYRFYHRKAIVSHDQLLRVVAKVSSTCKVVLISPASQPHATIRPSRVVI